jgi:hypothetical protein
MSIRHFIPQPAQKAGVHLPFRPHQPLSATSAAHPAGKMLPAAVSQPVNTELLGHQFSQINVQNPEAPIQYRSGRNSKDRRESSAPSQTGLPAELQSSLENLSGLSLADVRVHYNSPDPDQLGAFAFTQGKDIHIAPGQERHLPHEAWHVVQQAQGRVKPRKQMKQGVQVDDSSGLELEADVMGAKAVFMQAQDGASRIDQHGLRCGCAACSGKTISEQVSNVHLNTAAGQNRAGAGTVTQLCEYGHPEHAGIAKCPYPAELGGKGLRIPPKHVKGNPGGTPGKTTKASQDVMDHARQQILAGTAERGPVEPNDFTYSVPRRHPHREAVGMETIWICIWCMESHRIAKHPTMMDRLSR